LELLIVRLLICCGLFLLGVLGGRLWFGTAVSIASEDRAAVAPQSNDQTSADQKSADLPLENQPGAQSADPKPTSTRPQPDLSPTDVVRLQMNALQASSVDKSAIKRCYAFASPSNRSVTGPLERFTAMIEKAPYNQMVSGAPVLIGKEVVRDDRATVLVSMTQESTPPAVFRFYLSQQKISPYEDCWMTDAVLNVRLPQPIVAEEFAPTI